MIRSGRAPLFFASIGVAQSLRLLWALFLWVFGPKQQVTLDSNILKREFGTDEVFFFSSGRASISAFLESLDVGTGDTVLVSAFTCLAVPTAVIARGASPIYCDINPDSLNMSFDDVIRAVQDDTRVIIVQHTFGRGAEDIQLIKQYADDRGIYVLEDCALSIGSKLFGKKVGRFGHGSIFSFELSKTISCGWGGILVNNMPQKKQKLLEIFSCSQRESFIVTLRKVLQASITGLFYSRFILPIGGYVVAALFKLRIFRASTPEDEYSGVVAPDFQSVLAPPQLRLVEHQLRRLPTISEKLNANFVALEKALRESGFEVVAGQGAGGVSVSSRIAFLVLDPKYAHSWFDERGIETGSWFSNLISDKEIFNFQSKSVPNAAKIARHVINLPCNNRVTSAGLDYLKQLIQEFSEEHPEQLYKILGN